MSSFNADDAAEELAVLSRRVRKWPTEITIMEASPSGNGWRTPDPSYLEFAISALNLAGGLANAYRAEKKSES